MATMEKTMMTTMMVVMMMAVMSQVVQGTVPTPPVAEYICPIDGEAFFTYDELYQHFITAHPTTPIDIIWG